MRTRVVILTLAVLFSVGCGTNDSGKGDASKKAGDTLVDRRRNKRKQQIFSDLESFSQPDSMTLISIDGRDPPKRMKSDETFRSYPVLGRVSVDDALLRKRIMQALFAGMENARSQDLCFWPRHVVRVQSGGKLRDFVICFHCHGLMIFKRPSNANRGPQFATTDEAKKLLDEAFKTNSIPIAPK